MITRLVGIAGLLIMVAAASSTAETLYTLSSPIEEQSGAFGFSVSGAGDMDGDGFDDLVVGALRENPGASPVDAGRAYVHSGMTGALLHELASPNERQGGQFGNSVSGAGDVDGDGYADVVVGAHQEGPSLWSHIGRAYVFSGQTGALLLTLMSPNESSNGHFGCSVAGVGDVNGNGYPDVLVGAFGEWGYRGRAYVFDGEAGSLLHTLISPTQPGGNNLFGCSVSGLGDLDGDGRPDFVVGARGEFVSSSPQAAGRAHVFSGETGNLLHTLVSPNEETVGWFGYSVGGAGDVDGDGIPDIVVGAPYENPGDSPVDAGRVYVYSGMTGALLHELISPNETPDGRFGCSVAGAGDIDGDGHADLLVGANRENPGDSPEWAGRAYIFSGKTGAVLYTLVSPNEQQWGYFGYSVAGAGDVNGDGRPDIVVGAHSETPDGGPSWAGRAYVFSWMHLTGAPAGGGLVLQWSPWSPASEYWIYGASNEPWFVPDTSPPTFVNRVAVVPAGTTTWSSPAGIGDTAANWTYLVMAVDAASNALTMSNRVGEFDFGLRAP